MERKINLNSQNSFTKKKFKALTLSDFKIYYEATIINSYQNEERQTNQQMEQRVPKLTNI